jgi:hypothetical protein
MRKEAPLRFEAVVAKSSRIVIGIDRQKAQGVPLPRRRAPRAQRRCLVSCADVQSILAMPGGFSDRNAADLGQPLRFCPAPLSSLARDGLASARRKSLAGGGSAFNVRPAPGARVEHEA